MITVKEEAQAKKLAGQLTNNEITFDDAVSEYSEKYYTDGNGKVKENFTYQIKENLANTEDFSKIDSLAKDALSEVIKTNNGYSIYKCTGDKTTANIDDSATVDAVKKYITTNESKKIEDYFIAKANDFVAKAKADGFEAAAKASDVEVVSLPAFPLNYGNTSIADTLNSSEAKAYASASTNEDFLKKAFTMKLNDISEPMVMSNYVTVFQLKGIQNDKATEESTSKIKTEVIDYDQSGAQSALLSSSKVENNVADVYFNKFLSK